MKITFGNSNSEVFLKRDATKNHSKSLKNTFERVQLLVKLQAVGVQLY